MSAENVEDFTPTEPEMGVIDEESMELLDSWNSYVLSRKEAYLNERRAIIGREYEVNRRMWDAIIDREWLVMEERINGGVGVEQEILELDISS